MKKVFKTIGKFFKAIGRFFKKLFVGIIRFFVLVYRQMKKMRWADKKTIIESTTIVVTFIIFMGAYFMLDDFIIVQLLRVIGY